MSQPTTAGRKPRRAHGERGHLMLALATVVAIMGVMSTVAFQEYAETLRRDNEAEMMFRAQEIVRAIQRYRIDHGGVAPLELKLLMEPGPKGNYYLRRLYEDPLVADGKWGLLFVGPGNQIIDPNAADPVGLQQLQSGSGLGRLNEGQRLGGGSAFGNDRRNRGQDGQGAGGSNDQGGGQSGQSGSRLRGQTGLGGVGNGPGSAFGGGSQTGLPIAGVRTLSEDKPFRVYNGLDQYEQWQFTYFDLENQQLPGSRGVGGRPGQGRPNGQGNTGGLGNTNGRGRPPTDN